MEAQAGNPFSDQLRNTIVVTKQASQKQSGVPSLEVNQALQSTTLESSLKGMCKDSFP